MGEPNIKPDQLGYKKGGLVLAWKASILLLAGATLTLANIAAIATHEATHCIGVHGNCDIRFHMDNLATTWNDGTGLGEWAGYTMQIAVGSAWFYGLHRLAAWRPS